MKKALVALGLSFVLMFSSATALAEGGMAAKGGPDHIGKLHGLLGQLSLSDEQQDKIQNLIKTSRESLKNVREQMVANSQQLRDAMQSGSVNIDLVKQLADKQGELMSSLLVSQAQLKNQINDILTPEQREHLVNLADSVKGEMKKHFGDKADAPKEKGGLSVPSF